MHATNEPARNKNQATVERRSDREVVVTRTFDAPARLVFEAWSNPELFQKWWLPTSFAITLQSYEADVRVGGTYRLVLTAQGATMAFYGRYLEVTPHSRLAWTNDEGGEGGAVTTVTFTEKGGKTTVAVSNVFPTKEALDAEIGSTEGLPESLDQLEQLLAHAG
jgi:uncharacterized protein YndB with AHSA1/START domain